MNKHIEHFIKEQVNNVIENFNENKGIAPMFILFTEKEDKYNVNLCPIPPQLIQDQKGKDFIRYKLLEDLKTFLKKQGHKLLCVNWNSEAWMYEAKTDALGDVDDYKKLPKKEGLIISFDTEEGNTTYTYEIKRNMLVGDGGLNEDVSLEFLKKTDDSKSEGRFTNLFD